MNEIFLELKHNLFLVSHARSTVITSAGLEKGQRTRETELHRTILILRLSVHLSCDLALVYYHWYGAVSTVVIYELTTFLRSHALFNNKKPHTYIFSGGKK